MKRILIAYLLLVPVVINATESLTEADFGRIRISITNWCARAVQSEQVWTVGQGVKSRHGFSDAQMTELLSGCIPMLEERTDYKISHYHLFGLFERTCGTNAIPVLAKVVRDNKNDYDVRFAYAAYCEIANMDESCFVLAEEILDSPDYGEWSRWAAYSYIGRRRAKALKNGNGDQLFLQRCEMFYRSRQNRDSDFRKHVGYQKWPGPSAQDGVSQ